MTHIKRHEKILKVIKRERDGWDVYSFDKMPINHPSQPELPIVNFSTPIKTSLLLGEYRESNVIVHCSQQVYAGSGEEQIGFVVHVQGREIAAHSIGLSQDRTAIVTDEQGKIIYLKRRLADSFVKWIYGLEALTW